MSRASVLVAVQVVALTMACSLLPAQQGSANRPLGDVAREQRERHKAQKKAEPKYTLTEEGAEIAAPSVGALNAAEVAANEGPRIASEPARTALDQKESQEPDYLVVPEGTSIQVRFLTNLTRSFQAPLVEPPLEGQVTWPVRIGFATAIPALSKVTGKTTTGFYGYSYNYDSSETTYCVLVEVTSITIDGKSYKVKTNLVQYGYEVAVTLLEPLRIPR